MAGALAFHEAVAAAGTIVLEPVSHVEVDVPTRFLGDVLSDLNSRRGRVVSSDPTDDGQTTTWSPSCPTTELEPLHDGPSRASQAGTARSRASFDHFAELPASPRRQGRRGLSPIAAGPHRSPEGLEVCQGPSGCTSGGAAVSMVRHRREDESVSARRRAAGRAATAAAVVAALALGAPGIAGAGKPPPPPVTMYATDVAAGQDFACSVQTDATLACWGQNGYGQMGFGHKPYTLVGKRAFSISDAVAVATGWDHTCVLTTSREVTCLGHNTDGQLGAPARMPNQWTLGPVIAHLTSVRAVTAGYEHSCALLQSHRVMCWGDNGFGQLGDGTYASSARPRFVLAPRGGGPLRGVVAIAAGFEHTCALLADHQVWCWGLNSSGQLGQRLALARTSRPVHVRGITTGTSIAAGYAQTCAVLASGLVECWGSNRLRELGLPRRIANTPTPHVVPGVYHATQAAAGFDHTCALIVNGKVRCWGGDSIGQLGNQRTGTEFTPADVVGLPPASSITAGFWFTCANLRGGLVRCWGLGSQGQLGVGSRQSSSYPAHDALVRSIPTA